MGNRIRSAVALFALLLLLALTTTPSGAKKNDKSDVVYVCACLGNKSCDCMTEAKTEGPCACGTHGGPPLKAVPHDSAWAEENREQLAK